MSTAANPLETSLNGIGFSEDANAEETQADAGVAAEEQVEEQPTETAEETPELETESTESPEVEESEAAEATEEETEPPGYDSMLPIEQLKNYPEQLYQLAAEKFGIDPNLLSQQPVRNLLKSHIDADIDNRLLRDQLDTMGEEGETEEYQEEPEAGERGETQPVTPQLQLQAIDRFLNEGEDGKPIITPEGAKLYSEAMLDGYTALQEALDSGDAKKIADAQMRFTKSQASFAVAMFANTFPALLPRMIQAMPEQLWDGIVGAKFEQREEMKETHKSAREILAKDPRYSDIDRLIKSKAIYNYVLENPEVLEKTFYDANGRPITDPMKLAVAQYRQVIHAIRGRNYRPPAEYVRQGMRAGERHAREMADRKAAGRSIAGGARTRGIIGSSQDRYDRDNWVARMKKHAEESDPLGTFLRNSEK